MGRRENQVERGDTKIAVLAKKARSQSVRLDDAARQAIADLADRALHSTDAAFLAKAEEALDSHVNGGVPIFAAMAAAGL